MALPLTRTTTKPTRRRWGAPGPLSTSPAVRPGAVEVRPVRSRGDLTRFIRLPWRLYADAPLWVAPLMLDRRHHLSRDKNPFFEHAEAQYLLAWRGDVPVGRISAHVDHRLNEFQGVCWGLFGFFECERDPEAAHALLRAAEDWVAARGCDELVGPMDFTTNHECGLLVDGFEHRPQILENWHHPYYADLLTEYGLSKAMDLLKWRILASDNHRVHPVIYQLADRLEADHGVRIRTMSRRRMRDEVRAFMEVYNAAWQRNWGFVPLTEAELDDYAHQLKPLLEERWALVAEKDDEVVGAALTLPDYNRVLAAIGTGRLLPLGWLRALRAKRRIDMLRVFALGVKREHRHTGVAAAFYAYIWREVLRTGMAGAETGWILETNDSMNHAMEALGGDVIKRYRIYGKPIAG